MNEQTNRAPKEVQTMSKPKTTTAKKTTKKTVNKKSTKGKGSRVTKPAKTETDAPKAAPSLADRIAKTQARLERLQEQKLMATDPALKAALRERGKLRRKLPLVEKGLATLEAKVAEQRAKVERVRTFLEEAEKAVDEAKQNISGA